MGAGEREPRELTNRPRAQARVHPREYQPHQRRVHRGRSHQVARAAVAAGSAPVLIRAVALARVARVHVLEKRKEPVKKTRRHSRTGPCRS